MKKIILVALATALVTVQAYAFTGTIGFQGTMKNSTVAGVTTNTFNADWVTNSVGNTDAYAGIPGGVATTMANFSFTGQNTATPTLIGTVIPQWSFTFGGVNYSFDLLALTSAMRVSIPGLTTITETGTGIAHIGGLSETAVWSLDASSTGGFRFSASIHTSALGVPDGGSALALLGIALAGIEGVRRMLRARKA